ncbi:hypothetical protein KAFR_0A01040 [Kazachstania africana CBS 2517]|uniref:Protein kinase domain-containing protein n=1 Tax=Kazachstania africana (strain ATCC 22294 / BCRC 22015 / CBS 2517 / CECT 1963 / NBRC 1671 / NRRL Y-8276) TaxID=1071382 RepID=H2AME3_KAZAF|nr:hypothetical protein KAFR_0A01040 [Kazachstania africana CBS 2517]CCF55543.1 hypothetical protein KAFR_0A01040 [Kazachstania africana CBS 2517]
MSAANGTSSLINPSSGEKFNPGAVVAVGRHKVEIIKYLAEGGFAQIYSVNFIEYLNEFSNEPDSTEDSNIDEFQQFKLEPGNLACLKRVMVPDENGLNELRNEVNVMRKLKGTPNIVQYYDSNASRRHDGNPGFEVLLLMELCPNNSLLDYMNQRLTTKLSEKEILKIMYDVTLGISQMHYLQKPLIHRDIKIENVLVDSSNNFKLCDFGSTSACFPIVTSHQEIAVLTQNIYVHTTPQYRSPEMIDLYRNLPIDEKSDIWALGVFLYKLLFYTTPFEMTGQFAILHSKYEIPPNNYSSRLINLIIIMLAENPNLRPNIYQVMHQVCITIGIEPPIKDKYEMGPYDFENYTHFQNKLQNIQYKIFLLQRKKIENNGKLSFEDTNLLNELFATLFDISATIPSEVRIPSQSPITIPEDARKIDERNIIFTENQSPNDNLLSNVPGGEDLLQIEDTQTQFQPSSIKNETESKNEDHYYPTVGEVDHFFDSELKKREQEQQLQDSQNIPNASFPQVQENLNAMSLSEAQPNSALYTAMPQERQNLQIPPNQEVYQQGLKQHKSNNPFPKMGYTAQVNQNEGVKNNAYFIETQIVSQTQPQQQFQPILPPQVNQNVPFIPSMEQSQRGNKPNRTVNLKPNNPYTLPSFRNPPHSSEQNFMNRTSLDPQQNIKESSAPPPITKRPQPQKEYTKPNPLPPDTVGRSQNSDMLAKKLEQSTSASSANATSSSSSSSDKLFPEDEDIPPPVPPHPMMKRTIHDKSSLKNHTHLKEERSLIDLSPPREAGKRKSSEKKNSHVRRSRSIGGPRPLNEAPTTESIDIDLNEIKRKSLDLRMHQKNTSKYTSNFQGRSIEEGHKESSSESSISVSETDPKEMRRSFNKARQSLDLDRIRREAALSSNETGKKRSLFSVFKSDKK